MRLALLVVLVGCGGQPTAAQRPEPAGDPTGDPDGCSCARLNAPIEVPAQADQRARWERTASQLAALERAIAELFPETVPCSTRAAEQITPAHDQLAQLAAAHAGALREGEALDAESCDHFSRWRFVRWPERAGMARLMSAMRAGCFAQPAFDGLAELIIIRGCTTTSRRTDDQRAAICAASAATATDDSETSDAIATNMANIRSRARLLR